jgi:hypothetical protein
MQAFEGLKQCSRPEGLVQILARFFSYKEERLAAVVRMGSIDPFGLARDGGERY